MRVRKQFLMLEEPSVIKQTEQNLQSGLMLIFSYFFMCFHKDNPQCWNNLFDCSLKRHIDTLCSRLVQINIVWLLQLTWLQFDFFNTTLQKANTTSGLQMLRWKLIWSIEYIVLTVPLCSQCMRACAVSVGSCALRLSLPSWLGWSSRASLRSLANWTTCSGPALTGEPRSYMLLENSTAAAFEPGECVEGRTDYYRSQEDYAKQQLHVLPDNLQEDL